MVAQSDDMMDVVTNEVNASEKPCIPDMQLMKSVFLLQKNLCENREAVIASITKKMRLNDMGPYYEYACKTTDIPVDEKLLAEMKDINCKELERLDQEIERRSLAEYSSRDKYDAFRAKCIYLATIGDKDSFFQTSNQCYAMAASTTQKMKTLFLKARCGFFFLNRTMVQEAVTTAYTVLGAAGDWEKRNIIKVYDGMLKLWSREFVDGADVLFGTVSSYTCTYFIPFEEFCRYTIFAGLLAFSRSDIRTKIVEGTDIFKTLYNTPEASSLASAISECNYSDLFPALAKVETLLKSDPFLHQHAAFYVREMRVKVYKQLLLAFKSLTLRFLADTFGVSIEFMDKEIFRFVSSGRLNCKIDRIAGQVHTTHLDPKYAQYSEFVKLTDGLLNKIQKSSRIINM